MSSGCRHSGSDHATAYAGYISDVRSIGHYTYFGEAGTVCIMLACIVASMIVAMFAAAVGMSKISFTALMYTVIPGVSCPPRSSLPVAAGKLSTMASLPLIGKLIYVHPFSACCHQVKCFGEISEVVP
jgi:hypothetical protein